MGELTTTVKTELPTADLSRKADIYQIQNEIIT